MQEDIDFKCMCAPGLSTYAVLLLLLSYCQALIVSSPSVLHLDNISDTASFLVVCVCFSIVSEIILFVYFSLRYNLLFFKLFNSFENCHIVFFLLK